ncbi:coiled-coil domain-containing protein 150-like [Pomacea canaliculata]|uniref:coiled-coil domain-containing protein 150-like n=1 Tax=Pomacea canaliculata TaxID=400727 RepID=UPI000D7359AF|nr:coiled-coil domain-containing protein 150-like [Pomacea canaliculata]
MISATQIQRWLKPLFQDLDASNTLIEKEIKECAESSNPDRPQSESSLVEPRPSSFTQEGLISRVCKLESIIQTLRLGLAGSGSNSACTDSNGSGNRGKSQWKQPELDDKLSQVQQELGTEVARLKRHLVALQEELSLESQARQRAKEEIDQLKEALEEAVQARAEAAIAVDELSTTKQKLLRRVNELKEEVARETSLRASLEISHNTLLSRVRETESIAESERKETQNVTANAISYKQEVGRLTEELAAELSRRKMAEESCQKLIAEKEKALGDFETAQIDCKMASAELSRLQSKYAELIKKFEETEVLMEKQKAYTQKMEADVGQLQQTIEKTVVENKKLLSEQKQLSESDKSHIEQRLAMEEEINKLKMQISELSTVNQNLKMQNKQVQSQMETTWKQMCCREKEFTSAATGLETELNNVRRQLQSLEGEKEDVLRDKENLLEEVNQTVDTLVAERSRLQGELEKCHAEMGMLQVKCRQLDAENIQLMERISGLEHKQMAQLKVEATLKDMLEQKNKLAYENGKLQSELTQVKTELSVVTVESTAAVQQKKMNEILQDKFLKPEIQIPYEKAQKEAGEQSMAMQRLEGQLRHTEDLLQQKQHELLLTQAQREEVEREMGKVLGQLEVLESREKHKNQLHQKNMTDAKAVNREITSTLEAVMTSHSQLQELVTNLQAELGRRDTEIGRLKSLRLKEQDDFNLQIKRQNETIETLKDELKKEQDRSGRKINRDISELKKQNSNLSTRNGELMATNMELRQRVADMEKTVTDLQQKLSSQRHKMDHMHKAKKHVEDSLERMKKMHEDIDELERLRDEYMQKNKEQGETIAVFMSQMASLQEEFKQLAAAQVNTGRLLQLKEGALEKERKIREEVKKRYNQSRKRENEVAKQKNVSEEKLKEAHNESVEISKHLMEAHEWFKGKFEKLQGELAESKLVQTKLEQENADQRHQLLKEKSHVQEAAQRAKEMIKASRESISRLADFTEQADIDTKRQLEELRTEIAREKIKAKTQWRDA